MMFDSVREELQVKITSGRLPKAVQEEAAAAKPRPFTGTTTTPAFSSKPFAPAKPIQTAPAAPAAPAAQAQPSPRPAVAVAVAERPVKRETAGLSAPKTSPTLVGFNPKTATVPDWRLQLQNAVQQRKGTQGAPAAAAPLAAVPVSEPAAPAVATASTVAADPRVANALKRIDNSRNTFQSAKPAVRPAVPQPVAKPLRFEVVPTQKKVTPAPAPAPTVPVVHSLERPAATPIPLIKRDTNKLPKLAMDLAPKAIPAEPTAIAEPVEEAVTPAPSQFSQINRIRIPAENIEPEIVDEVLDRADDIEDLAHFSMRFGSGLFDLIITSFVSLLVLSPVAFARSEWFTAPALLTFAGTLAIVTFVYMTLCLGFFGKTMGMRLFALELVDAVENEYPTLHQAAVNSSVYILSLVLGGAGFLTILFNEEKRAAHDLLSGTILVREF